MEAVVVNNKGQKIKDKGQITVALAGNPNAGKTTLFNALTGLRQKVANYPGVTVERKEGIWRVSDDKTAKLIDLPGLYSLDANSIDEQIASDVLTGKIIGIDAPDVIVAVVDATNLERNLYLVTQLLEYKIPLVIALTMIDEAEKSETRIDAEKLSEALKVPVVPIVASKARNRRTRSGDFSGDGKPTGKQFPALFQTKRKFGKRQPKLKHRPSLRLDFARCQRCRRRKSNGGNNRFGKN